MVVGLFVAGYGVIRVAVFLAIVAGLLVASIPGALLGVPVVNAVGFMSTGLVPRPIEGLWIFRIANPLSLDPQNNPCE